MKKPLDRITEAYYNQMGEVFGQKVRDRIHWVCSNAQGENILDIGCSQGIVPIVLGREGKNVLGIDLLRESIEYANNMLENEAETTKNHVNFKEGNFITYNFDKDQLYDCIILGEILEHVTDPKRFMKKAQSLLNPNGRIIVTVPFGVNDYFDHKKTYYLADLLDLAVDGLKISDVEFFGKWIGAVFYNSSASESQQNNNIETSLLKQLEESFYNIEKDLLNNISKKTQKIQNLSDKNNKDNEDNILNQLKDENKYLNKQIAILQGSNNEKEKSIQLLVTDQKSRVDNNQNGEKRMIMEKLRELLTVSEKNNLKMKDELLKSYEKEEVLLKSHQKLMKRYNALKQSKLGRITMSYRKWRKNLSRRK